MPERAISTNELPKAQLAFNVEFHISARKNLELAGELLSNAEFKRQEEQLSLRFEEDLKSEIRERFCTQQYQTIYTLRDGKLINRQYDQPFGQIIKKGIESRRQNGSTDQTREQAELIGFERIEQILNGIAEPSSVVSISPRGAKESIYQRNFFDVFQKQENGQIIMTRFTSTATLEGFQAAAQKLNPGEPRPIVPTDAYFLSHPLKTTASLEQILEAIELDKTAMEKDYVESIVENCMPVILAYVNNPSEAGYRAAVNFADILAGKKTLPNFQSNDSAIERLSDSLSFRSTINLDFRRQRKSHGTVYQLSTINYLASLPVRPVQTGCGISGSTGIGSVQTFSKLSAWSVADFGRGGLDEDKSDFPCPRCGHNITYGAGITECPGCGLEAACA